MAVFTEPLNHTKPMLALVASPTFKAAFDFEFLRESRTTEADKVARLITNLHRMLVNPKAAPDAAAAAKRRLLAVLERAKDLHLPFMIVPPIADFPARVASEPHVEPEEADPACVRCNRPIALTPARIVSPFPKMARASSSSRFRAKPSPNRSGHRSPRKLATSLTESRGADSPEYAESL